MVLDVACGPRGEPGTTIADALPSAVVRCTDSCSIAIESVPVVELNILSSPGSSTEDAIDQTTFATVPSPHTPRSIRKPLKLPPLNLSKSVCNLDQLNQNFAPNSMHAIVCCYGYGLSTNIIDALEQAHTVLMPGGILVLGTWKYSPLLALGHDVLTTLRSGTGDSADMLLVQHLNDLDVGLPPLVQPSPAVEYSEPGEWESLLSNAGFHPSDIVSSCHSYPMNMGTTRSEQFNFGTLLIREELQHFVACSDFYGTFLSGIGLRQSFTEDAFWNNLPKYCVETSSNVLPGSSCMGIGVQNRNHQAKFNGSEMPSIETSTLWMQDNKFMLTVSTK